MDSRALPPPRYPTDGKLRIDYECHCCECQEPALGLGRTRQQAEKALRAMSWKKLRGYWTCWSCVALRSRQTGEGGGT